MSIESNSPLSDTQLESLAELICLKVGDTYTDSRGITRIKRARVADFLGKADIEVGLWNPHSLHLKQDIKDVIRVLKRYNTSDERDYQHLLYVRDLLTNPLTYSGNRDEASDAMTKLSNIFTGNE